MFKSKSALFTLLSNSSLFLFSLLVFRLLPFFIFEFYTLMVFSFPNFLLECISGKDLFLHLLFSRNSYVIFSIFLPTEYLIYQSQSYRRVHKRLVLFSSLQLLFYWPCQKADNFNLNEKSSAYLETFLGQTFVGSIVLYQDDNVDFDLEIPRHYIFRSFVYNLTTVAVGVSHSFIFIHKITTKIWLLDIDTYTQCCHVYRSTLLLPDQWVVSAVS